MDPIRVVRVYSLDELRGITNKDARGMEAILWPSKKRYLFNPGSLAADDGDLVIQPEDHPADCHCCGGKGRWEIENPPPDLSSVALKVVSEEFLAFGVGDLVIPTGFVPKLVTVIAAVQVLAPHGAMSMGQAIGTDPADQSVVHHGDAVPSAFTDDALTSGEIIHLESPIGFFGATIGTVTQMDETQVKITISSGGGSCRVTVLG